jgi:NAD-dependent SIR2 family protein deacetylase
MKQCSKCKKQKDESEFSKNRKNKDGLRYYCKDCERAYTRERYEQKEVLRKNTTIIKTFIVLPEVLSRSSAVDVKSGRTRTNITNTADTKTDWVCGARNVQIKLPTKHVRNDYQKVRYT